jgi:hypothetical protein
MSLLWLLLLLQQQVALHFVEDERSRFKLALACGNLEIAMKAAHTMDDEECWHRLAVEAMRQGNHQTVELACVSLILMCLFSHHMNGCASVWGPVG